MRARILVVHGRSPEVLLGMSRTVAEVFGHVGAEVSVRPGDDVESADAFDSAVLCGQLANGDWRDENLTFIRRHRRALEHMTLAYALALGPGLDPSSDLRGVELALGNVLNWYNELRPVKIGLFHVERPGVFADVRDWAETLKPNLVGPSLEAPSGLRDFLDKWPRGQRTDRMPSRDTRGWPR